MVDRLVAWQREPREHDVADVLLGGRFAQAAYQELGELAGVEVNAELPHLDNDDTVLAQAGLAIRFNFDGKGAIGLNDGEASGGQQVLKSLILLVGLLKDDETPGGFVFIDEPFAHLDVRNIQLVGHFLRSTRAQYLLTTPITHNVELFEPAEITLVTGKKLRGERCCFRGSPCGRRSNAAACAKTSHCIRARTPRPSPMQNGAGSTQSWTSARWGSSATPRCSGLPGSMTLQTAQGSSSLQPWPFIGVPVEALQALQQLHESPESYWVIENRASFERQARQREPAQCVLWVPGRPSTAWPSAVARLLEHAPAPARVSADADPAGIEIALTVGALLEINRIGRKAEQEGWV